MTSYIAVDAGSIDTKIVTDDGEHRTRPSAPIADVLRGAADAGAGAELCLAVPDSWLDGSTAGGRRQEALRSLAEDELGLTVACWPGQLAAVAALAASQRGFTEPGIYLGCDLGATGVRVAACEVTGTTIRPLAVHDAPGGGWLDFGAAIRATLGDAADGWFTDARGQDERARIVLGRARKYQEYRDAPVTLGYELTAGQLLDCFTPATERIQAGVRAVSGDTAPRIALLTGGLSWLTGAEQLLADVARAPVTVLEPHSAALGALLFATGRARLPAMPPVSLPMHRIRDGLLEETPLPLSWDAAYAPCEALTLNEPELTLTLGGRRLTLPVPGLENRAYRIGVRPSWPGSGVLVLRNGDVHVFSLGIQENLDE